MLTRRRALRSERCRSRRSREFSNGIPTGGRCRDKTPSATRRLLQRFSRRSDEPLAGHRRREARARRGTSSADGAFGPSSLVARAHGWHGCWLRCSRWFCRRAALAVAVLATGSKDRATPSSRASPLLSRTNGLWAPDTGTSVTLAVSRDGRHVAFVALGVNRQTGLWIRELGALTPRPLPGTESASSPFWSPDNRSLGFFADGKLKRIDSSGSPAVTLCDAPDNRGGSWGSDVIIFATLQGPLQRVPASGGSPTLATALGPGEVSHLRPGFLPDGRHFFYRAVSPGEANSEAPVYLTALNSANRTWLLNTAGANVVYSRAHLLFLRRNTLMAQPFDDRRLALTGEAAPIAENVRISMTSRRRRTILGLRERGARVSNRLGRILPVGVVRPQRQAPFRTWCSGLIRRHQNISGWQSDSSHRHRSGEEHQRHLALRSRAWVPHQVHV